MQKKFLTNLGLLLFLNLLVKPFWVLGIDRSVQNTVGSEEFGFYFSILNFSFLFNILLDLGITNFNNRNIAQNTQLLNKHFSSILILKLLLGVLYIVISFVIGMVIGYDSRQFYILAWVAFNQFLLSFILYLRSNITGLLMFKTDSMLSVLDRLLMILFCSILLWGNLTEKTFRIEWFVYAQTLAYAITVGTALIIVIKKSAFRRLHWNRPFLIMILKKSLPFALLVLLMAQYNRMDTVIIERILPETIGKQQAGVYAQAFRLLDAANMIAFLFAVILLPIFSRMIKLKESVENLVKLSFSMLFSISVITAASSFFYGAQLIEWLYPIHMDELIVEYEKRLEEASLIFRVLMMGFISISATYVFGTLLTANGSLKQLNIVASVGVIISLALNLTLVPGFQAIGSAFASVSAQSVTAIAQIILVILIFRFRTNYRFIIELVLFSAGVAVMGYLSQMTGINWKLSLLLFVGASMVLAIFLEMLDIRSFIRIIRSERR
jgi:O-antigen/teichoic acid export membrane protein